ncbi:TspO/MBR family protein [Rhodomicrobium lacus]|uniref:TspO/MBR family protein n=1 Tax=Rhodomicrobium TaxID=1068 RepID=UPI001AECFB67|nr:TspO/MBR family protein [Rhodomicrobium lacus]WKW51534.1 TspO/MBR family protein [Rhodomicrobium lacus]
MTYTHTDTAEALAGPRPGFWKPFGIAFLLAMVVGGLGALTTDLSSWYFSLNKPSWQPPDWAFGPAWTVIYAFTALAAVYAWREAPTRDDRLTIVLLFLCTAFFNLLWSLLFFRLHRPDWALIEVGALWASVFIPIVVLARYSKTASWLLVPYLAWVTFAGFLNYTVVQLNPQIVAQ